VKRLGSSHASAPARFAPLLDLDPDLGRFVARDRLADAHREIVVRVIRLSRGPWSVEPLVDADARHLGLLVLEGLLGRELLADDIASLELVGPGDVLRPWDDPTHVQLLRAVVRWSAFTDVRMAILDRESSARLVRYPELYAALMERLSARMHRLAVMQAIAQLNRVDRRVLTLLWHLAERWGQVTPDGVLLPLVLSHRTLSQLVGARRPTVSTAIGQLTRRGELRRTHAGAWLLTGRPVGSPDAVRSRFVPPRRAMLSPTGNASAEA
jgi:hypothetical protein